VRILLSNDDGIHAPGLAVLAAHLANDSRHEVYVCAPDRQRSATGHSLTLHKPLRVQHEESAFDLQTNAVKGAWSTTGTPADCVKLAVCELMPAPPDVVVSGINSGPNLGSDLLYSGTVAAAMEAAFMDIPAIAVSAKQDKRFVYETAAHYIGELLGKLKDAPRTARGLININVPALKKDEVKGAKLAELGLRLYKDSFDKRSDPNGRDYYWLSGHAIEDSESTSSDVYAVNQGYISVTPVVFNMTDFALFDKLAQWI
jgi:5'-nucleotidase